MDVKIWAGPLVTVTRVIRVTMCFIILLSSISHISHSAPARLYVALISISLCLSVSLSLSDQWKPRGDLRSGALSPRIPSGDTDVTMGLYSNKKSYSSLVLVITEGEFGRNLVTHVTHDASLYLLYRGKMESINASTNFSVV